MRQTDDQVDILRLEAELRAAAGKVRMENKVLNPFNLVCFCAGAVSVLVPRVVKKTLRLAWKLCLI
ncbi:MAG: hypothetical protein LBS10_11380 [Gracilibacteraceae bacterium]|nr:hypothetical protein [Gracilibacteraceae bacterium]